MNHSEYLWQLESGGRIMFESSDPPSLDPVVEADCVRAIERLDERRRLEMAHVPPRLNREQAIWAVRLVYRAAQFLVYRDLGAEQVRKELLLDCPGEVGPERTYSVDLAMWWLPDLHRRASRVSYQDPLTACLLELGYRWPLSSVGMKLQERDDSPDLEFIKDDRSLQALYVDRVIAGKDRSRMADEQIAAAVRDAVGQHEDLSAWAMA